MRKPVDLPGCYGKEFLDWWCIHEGCAISDTCIDQMHINKVAEARRHHKKHGDMDGHTCLLAECELHYPKFAVCDGVRKNDV